MSPRKEEQEETSIKAKVVIGCEADGNDEKRKKQKEITQTERKRRRRKLKKTKAHGRGSKKKRQDERVRVVEDGMMATVMEGQSRKRNLKELQNADQNKHVKMGQTEKTGIKHEFTSMHTKKNWGKSEDYQAGRMTVMVKVFRQLAVQTMYLFESVMEDGSQEEELCRQSQSGSEAKEGRWQMYQEPKEQTQGKP